MIGIKLLLNEYQDKAGSFQLFEAPPNERVLGLLEESGEVAGVFKRQQRGDYSTQGEFINSLVKELGDALWYLSRVAADNEITLQEVAEINLSKLEDRRIRNTLKGKGSSR